MSGSIEGGCMKGGGVLFSEMTPPDGDEAKFNDWYDNHHMPSHVYGVPGFRSGQRYKDGAAPHYLAIYDLDAPSTLTDEEYRTRKYTPDAPTKAMLSRVTGFTRYIGEEIHFAVREGLSLEQAMAGPVMLAVFFAVPPDRAGEFEDWYAGEHLPLLLRSPQWRMGRIFRVVDADPTPFTHMMLHYIDDMSVLDGAEVGASRATEWRNKLAGEDWFKPHMVHYDRRGKRYHKGEPEAKTFKLPI
ncbi:MAG: hypothetical protein VW547_12935 [Alphaproteobacteria bacterium]|jgi:hypothetical protein